MIMANLRDTTRRSKRLADNNSHLEGPISMRARVSTFCFFALPPEIRDEIYLLVFGPDAGSGYQPVRYIVHFPAFKLIAHDAKDRSGEVFCTSRAGLPSWTAVSKQFLREAIANFAKEKVFELHAITLRQYIYRSVPKQDAGLQLSALLQAIRTIKAPGTIMKTVFSEHKAVLKLLDADERLLSVFLELRGTETAAQHLELEWKYALIHPYPPGIKEYLFESITLSKWPNSFSRVTIIVTLTSYLAAMCSDGTWPQSRHSPSARDVYNAAKIQLWKEAEAWARRLVHEKIGEETRCRASDEDVDKHWTGVFETW